MNLQKQLLVLLAIGAITDTKPADRIGGVRGIPGYTGMVNIGAKPRVNYNLEAQMKLGRTIATGKALISKTYDHMTRSDIKAEINKPNYQKTMTNVINLLQNIYDELYHYGPSMKSYQEKSTPLADLVTTYIATANKIYAQVKKDNNSLFSSGKKLSKKLEGLIGSIPDVSAESDTNADIFYEEIRKEVLLGKAERDHAVE